MAVCTTCDYGDARVRGECMTCFMWRKNHGEQRPEQVIVAHGRRILAKRMEQRAS